MPGERELPLEFGPRRKRELSSNTRLVLSGLKRSCSVSFCFGARRHVRSHRQSAKKLARKVRIGRNARPSCSERRLA